MFLGFRVLPAVEEHVPEIDQAPPQVWVARAGGLFTDRERASRLTQRGVEQAEPLVGRRQRRANRRLDLRLVPERGEDPCFSSVQDVRHANLAALARRIGRTQHVLQEGIDLRGLSRLEVGPVPLGRRNRRLACRRASLPHRRADARHDGDRHRERDADADPVTIHESTQRVHQRVWLRNHRETTPKAPHIVAERRHRRVAAFRLLSQRHADDGAQIGGNLG